MKNKFFLACLLSSVFTLLSCSSRIESDLIQGENSSMNTTATKSALADSDDPKECKLFVNQRCTPTKKNGKITGMVCYYTDQVLECFTLNDNTNNGGGGSSTPIWNSLSKIYNTSGNKLADFDDFIIDVRNAANNGSAAQANVYIKSPYPFQQILASSQANGNNVGESFIALSAGGFTRVFGFYPTREFNPLSVSWAPSVFIDKSNSPYDLQLTFGLTNQQLQSFLNIISSQYNNHEFSILYKNDATLVRDLLSIINPSFNFSTVQYPNNLGTGVGSCSGYLAYDIDNNYSQFFMAMYDNTGGMARPNE